LFIKGFYFLMERAVKRVDTLEKMSIRQKDLFFSGFYEKIIS